MVQWPAEFRIGDVYAPSQPEGTEDEGDEAGTVVAATSSSAQASAEAILNINTTASSSIGPANMPSTPVSVAPSVAGSAIRSVGEFGLADWAVSQLAAAFPDTGFQFPADYVVRSKDSQETRRKKEAHFRRQWEEAVASYEPPAASGPPRWQWMCPTCVGKAGNALVGAEVQVWWHDDERTYRGAVNAFDEASGWHRVLYEDGEWEFVSLLTEPFVLCAPEKRALRTAVTTDDLSPVAEDGAAVAGLQSSQRSSASSASRDGSSRRSQQQQQHQLVSSQGSSTATPTATGSVAAGEFSASSTRARRSSLGIASE